MKDNQFEHILQKKLDELPREIQPRRDLWPGIDLALEDQAHRTGKPGRWTAIAASVAVFGLLGLLMLNDVSDPNTQVDKLSQLVSSVSEQHEKQKQFLLTTYEQQPALTDNWKEQLNELDNAASVIKSALEEDPGDANLIRMLQQIYQQQIKLIQSVHQPKWL